MSTTNNSNVPALVPIPGQLVLIELVEPGDPGGDRVDRALAGYFAGYSGTTLVGYRLDLRQWVTWTTNLHLDVLAAERAHIELYARCCESEGKAPSTIGRRLSTICGFYKYCEQERIIDRNPAAHVRRPKQDDDCVPLQVQRRGAALWSGGRSHHPTATRLGLVTRLLGVSEKSCHEAPPRSVVWP